LHLKDNLLTIDKGTADGVDKDMGVVSGNGVVGIVYKAGPHYSVVIPVLNSQSSISCMIERRRYFGYLHWTGGASNMAFVDDVPRHARFKLYERIVTSGYSTVFPEGIPVGKIIHVYNSPDGVSYRIQVHLYTDFSTLRDVMVIDNEKVTEQVELLRHATDTLALTNR
jgi:rod shape-determining protein MreC